MGTAVRGILRDASAVILFRVEAAGDGLLPQGQWTFPSTTGSLMLGVRNANNHQLTWGVANSALVALSGFMRVFGWWPTTFDIFDGGTQVGTGIIEAVTPAAPRV